MKIVERKESVILTAVEKAILDKAYDIIDEITDKSYGNGELYVSAMGVYNTLTDFLGNEEIYKIEPPAEDVSKVVLEITI